jgi:TPR repeat protein
MKTPVCTLSLVALLGLLPAFAEPINLPDLQVRAAKDDPEAELDLARAYHLGKGVPVDYAKAADLYRKSAEQGNAKAMYNLGYMQHHGQGMPEDDVKAEGWFQKAADKALPAAQLEVGLAYLHGDNGRKQDLNKAAQFLLLAAQPGSPPSVVGPAANALAYLFETGGGVAQDSKQAIFWYTHAAENGSAMAKGNLGRVYSEGTIVKKDPVQSYMWLKLATYAGDPDATHMLSDYLAANVFTPEQKTEGDRLAADFQREHHQAALKGPIPTIVTPEMKEIGATPDKPLGSGRVPAATNAAPAVTAPPVAAGSSAAKASGAAQGSASVGQ